MNIIGEMLFFGCNYVAKRHLCITENNTNTIIKQIHITKAVYIMKWKIISDSSCDLMKKDVACDEVDFTTIPFILNIGNEEYIDNENLDVDKMISAMESCATACSSACPSPASWLDEYDDAENAIAITISSNLSGSHNSAVIAKEMVTDQNKKVAILDSRSTGPELVICIEELVKLIKSGLSFDEVVEKANETLTQTRTVFALCSFDTYWIIRIS